MFGWLRGNMVEDLWGKFEVKTVAADSLGRSVYRLQVYCNRSYNREENPMQEQQSFDTRGKSLL